MSRLQNSFEPYPDPKISPIGPQKYKIKSKSKVRIEENVESKMFNH